MEPRPHRSCKTRHLQTPKARDPLTPVRCAHKSALAYTSFLICRLMDEQGCDLQKATSSAITVCIAAGQHQREWLEARPRLRLALAALEEEPELQSVREEAAGARSLAHRAGRWQQLWHPRQLEMLQLTRRQWQPGPSQQAGSLQQRPPTGWQQNGNGSQMVQVQLPTPHDRHLKICAAPLPPPPQPWAHEQAPLWPPAYAAHGCQRAHMQPMQVVMPNGQLGLLLTLEPSHTVRAQLEPLPPLQQPQQLSWQLQQPHQQPNLLPLWPPQPPAPWHTGQQPRPPPPAVLQSNAMVPPPQPPPPPPQACPHTMPALQEVPAAAKRQLGDSFTDTDAADRSIRHRSESTVSDAAIDGCFAAAVSNRAAARELRAQLQGSGKAAEPLSPPMAAAARCPASATGAGAREAASIQPADAAPEQQSGATPLAAQDLQDTGVPPACLQQLAQAGDDTEVRQLLLLRNDPVLHYMYKQLLPACVRAVRPARNL